MRPTATGWRLAAAALILLAAGYLLAYPALVALGVGAALVLAAGFAALAAQPRPEVSHEVYPDRIARGEIAVALVVVSNSRRRGTVWLSAWDEYALRGEQRRIPVALPQSIRSGSYEVGYELPADRRGVARVGPLLTEASDPLGVARRRARFGQEHVLRVYPHTHSFDLLSASRSLDREDGGAETVLEGSVTFHRLREYVPGDDLRRVHWRSSARMNTLMVRQNVDVTRPEATVALVTARGSYQGEEHFEAAVEAAASALAAAGAAQVPARLVTGAGVRVAGRGGPGDMRAFLDELAAAEFDDDGDLPRIADLLRPMAGGGLLVVACGTAESADPSVTGQLAVRYRPAVLARFGPGSAQAAWSAARAPGGAVTIEAADAAEFCRRWRERSAAA